MDYSCRSIAKTELISETFNSVKLKCQRDIQVQELYPDAVNE